MLHSVRLAVVVALILAATPGAAMAAGGDGFQPGTAGIGDPYFPLDGNGGYDVQRYLLDVSYAPATGTLTGTANITARATQNLSRFNLDLTGLTVRSVSVDGSTAGWSRDGQELTVVPRHGLRVNSTFTTVVRYDGVPDGAGFVRTGDGATVMGEPHSAASWYPVNDHPSDKAAYTIRVTVPAGLSAVSNGVLESSRTQGDRTTWVWQERAPMASYLSTITIGHFDLRGYQEGGIRYWDAIDSNLLRSAFVPRTGSRYAISQSAGYAYKRLSRVISVPAAGARLSFWMDRDVSPGSAYAFVEAHTVGADDWTMLPDLGGHTGTDLGPFCLTWSYPFLTHYLTDSGDITDVMTCKPGGTTGNWSAATGKSGGYEQWTVDLSGYAGRDAEVSISYVANDIGGFPGVFIDDVAVSTGTGSTSFEDDGDVFDGWTVPGTPQGIPQNPNDWISGTAAQNPPPLGTGAAAIFAREPEIIAYLSSLFGPYPFDAAGGIVDDSDQLWGALESQTRPIYGMQFFGDPEMAGTVVAHELSHQWYGDSVALARWQDIWLNEGFATYAEWLWNEHDGRWGGVQDQVDMLSRQPADSWLWQLTIGDPGPDRLFDPAVYLRGGLTLHALRQAVGDPAFFQIMRTWASCRAGGHGTTPEFIQLAERISGKELGSLFNEWLSTATRPASFVTAPIDPRAPGTTLSGPGRMATGHLPGRSAGRR